MNKFALALRSELYSPKEIIDFARLADKSNEVSHLLFPDIPGGMESIELSVSSLAVSERLTIGSGVLRPLEHDPKILARRLVTIQSLSGNRFVLGVGVGSPGPHPGETVRRMFTQLEDMKKNFESSNPRKTDVKFPDVFIAALRPKMARISIDHSDGLLLNFCSPQYAMKLIAHLSNGKAASGTSDSSSRSSSPEVTLACYVKIFFAKDQVIADKLLLHEFVKYDNLPQYHKMFEKDGIGLVIKEMRERLSNPDDERRTEIPSQLKEISLSNPSKEELTKMLGEFRKAGIGLPCVYPYFSPAEETSYKTKVLEMILESLKS